MSETNSVERPVGPPTSMGATATTLTGTQQSALEWIRSNGPVERTSYRAAGFTTKTIGSLMDRGLVERKQETEPRWRFVYVAKSPNTTNDRSGTGPVHE